MQNNFRIFIGLIIVIFIGVFIYYFNSPKVTEESITTPIVVEDSILGCYVATLSKDVYTMTLLGENQGKIFGRLAFNNYEKDSSSGIFEGTYENQILLGNYSFDSEGSHSDMQVIFKKVGDTFVRGYGDEKNQRDDGTFIDLSKINYDANSTFIKDKDCMIEFQEKNGKFIFNYNPFFKAYQQNEDILSNDWRIGAKAKGLTLAKVYVPKVYIPNTNFSSATMSIGASTDIKEISSCTSATALNGEVVKGSTNISGYPFTKFFSTDAGAGNYYETTSYRGLLDGDCYALEYTIHSTNIRNYSPEQNIKEFDKVKMESEFETMIQSFKFLVNID